MDLYGTLHCAILPCFTFTVLRIVWRLQHRLPLPLLRASQNHAFNKRPLWSLHNVDAHIVTATNTTPISKTQCSTSRFYCMRKTAKHFNMIDLKCSALAEWDYSYFISIIPKIHPHPYLNKHVREMCREYDQGPNSIRVSYWRRCLLYATIKD